MKRVVVVLAFLAACAPAAEPPRTQPVPIASVAPKPPEPFRPLVGKREIVQLPLAEAIPHYREWLEYEDPSFGNEAIAQLTWAGDSDSAPRIAKSLENSATRLAAARALAELEDARTIPALQEALANAVGQARTAIVWALIALREPSILEDALTEYRSGALQVEKHLDGTAAFMGERLVALIPPARATAMAASDDVTTQILGVAALVRQADSKPPAALQSAVEKADQETWIKLMDGIAEGAGGRGLVLALPTVAKTSPTAKFRYKAIFDRMRARPDPRAADALSRYLEAKPDPHWRTEAALRLAEINDVRAVPHLAWRMEQDPLKLYGADDVELRRDDTERVVSARMLTELALLHPEARAEMRKIAVKPVRSWLTDRPQPHANGLRFLAAVEATDTLPLVRKWADPRIPLPKPGQQDFPPAWATAQVALRSLGAMKDSWPIVAAQLNRRPERFDATMNGLMQGGTAVLGMTLRALSFGAIQGFAEWGDAKAYPLLVKFIEEPMNNEQAKAEAGVALGLVATDAQMVEIANKIATTTNVEERRIYFDAFVSHGSGAEALVESKGEIAENIGISRAIGASGLTPPTAKALRERVRERPDHVAAVALMLGGDRDDARFAIRSYADRSVEMLEKVKLTYLQSVSSFEGLYDRGALARWTSNADAASHVKLHDERQDWVRQTIAKALQDLEYDSGPKTLTRMRLRSRAVRDATAKRAESLRLLRYLNERGAIAALTESKTSP